MRLVSPNYGCAVAQPTAGAAGQDSLRRPDFSGQIGRATHGYEKLLTGTVVGTITSYIIGYLIFEVAVADFYAANMGSATGLFRDTTLQVPIALANIALAALITLGVMGRSNAPTISQGAITGGVIGFLVWFHADFVLYGFTNMWNMTVTVIDPALEFVHCAITGAVIALALGRVPKTAAA